MAQFQGNFRSVSDVYDLKSDKREFRANANIMHDLLGHEAALTKEVESHLLVAGFTRAPHPRQQIKSVDDPTGKGAKSSRGWFVPPKLSLAVCDTSGETLAPPSLPVSPDATELEQTRSGIEAIRADQARKADAADKQTYADSLKRAKELTQRIEARTPPIQPTTLAQLPMELAQPEVVDTPETAYSDASATQSVDTCKRTATDEEAPQAPEVEPIIASGTYSDVEAILAAANTPIVAEGFDITKRPTGVRVIEGSEEAFAPITFRPFDYLEAINECRAYLNLNGNEKLIHALALASVGIRVFPVKERTKIPQITDWQQKATSKYDSVIKWFATGNANVAVATGATNGGYELVVVDIDTKHGAVGFKGLEELEATLGKLPETLTATTPSGGEHRYYRVPQGRGVASRKLKTAEGFDVGDFQAAGKLVIAPPSVFADPDDGYTHKPYKWANDLPIAELPDAWIAPQVARAVPKHPSIKDSDAGQLISGQEALDALATLDHISPDVGYEDWVNVTALLHNVEGGYEAWLSWTQRGTKFRDGDEAKWDAVAGMALASCGSVAKLFALAGADPRYVNPKSRQAQKSDVPEGMAEIAGSNEAFANTAELGELPSVQSLMDSITAKAGVSQGAWLAHAVLTADVERVKAYQRDNPTTSDDKPRNLVTADGSVNWVAATFTTAMHAAGEVLILQPNHSISAVKELINEDAGKVVSLVRALFEGCPIAKVWKASQTTKNANMFNTIVSAVWKARIQRQAAPLRKSSSNKTETLPAQPAVHAGFDLSKPPASLTNRAAPDAPAQPPVHSGFDLSRPPDTLTGQANGVVSSGVVAPPAGTGVPVHTVEAVPVTIGSVASLPPKRAQAAKTPPLELLKAAMLEVKRGVWFTCKTTREIYTLTEGGWYEHVPVDKAETEVTKAKEGFKITIGSMTPVKDTVRLLQQILPEVEFCTVPHLIPMRNGVLDSETRTLHPYSMMLPFNWHIPHDYTDSESCDVWKGFIAKQLGGDEGRTKTLRAFLRCMLGGAYQAQKYLEVVGTGGSGKSQLMNVCVALMGEENTVQSSLVALDGKDGTSRFETSNLYGKKLVMMPDQEKFFGASTNFRCITGNDHIRNEKKNVQAGNSFVFQGFVIITANQFMNPKNNGSAILRRRVPMLFDVAASDAEKALYPDGIGKHIIDHELAGVLNWILAMPLTEARAQLRTPDAYTTRLNEEVEDGNNPVRAWLRDEVVSCGRGEETCIGSDIRDPLAKQSPEWGMYTSYCEYCRGAGNSPMNRKGFIDMVLNETRGKGVEHKKERARGSNYNKWILSGLRLRKDSDD